MCHGYLSPLLGVGVVPGLLHRGAGHPHRRGPGPCVPVWVTGAECPVQLAATWAHSAASSTSVSPRPPAPCSLHPCPQASPPGLDGRGPRHTQPQASGSASRCIPQPSGLPGTSESCPLCPRGPPQDEPALTFRPAASSAFAPEPGWGWGGASGFSVSRMSTPGAEFSPVTLLPPGSPAPAHVSVWGDPCPAVPVAAPLPPPASHFHLVSQLPELVLAPEPAGCPPATASCGCPPPSQTLGGSAAFYASLARQTCLENLPVPGPAVGSGVPTEPPGEDGTVHAQSFPLRRQALRVKGRALRVLSAGLTGTSVPLPKRDGAVSAARSPPSALTSFPRSVLPALGGGVRARGTTGVCTSVSAAFRAFPSPGRDAVCVLVVPSFWC